MRAILLSGLLILTACAGAPLDIHNPTNPLLAGRCELVAYNSDQEGVHAFGYLGVSGLLALGAAQARADQRRQAIYNACLAAGGPA